MLLSRFAYTKISPKNVLYWRDRGYNVRAGGRGGINTGQRLKVKVEELQPNSNIDVSCRCNSCGRKYIQRFSRDKETCYPCRKSENMLGNKYGSGNKGKTIEALRGELHPRWNSNKVWITECCDCQESVTPHWQADDSEHRCLSCAAKKRVAEGTSLSNRNPRSGDKHPRWNQFREQFKRYADRARWLSDQTYRANLQTINPHGYPRTLCGVEGGYQLDHKVSIKKAYDLGWTPEQCADISNLQLLPWADNRAKWK